ncbi:hypothetical protein L1049_028333 [Liquidambar formosana]|uniref:Uncharacterized protein n=1 Tax=Liquidambar formosana TaxID=63359 RepID=A0AAP0WW50_LIQFO
MKWNSPVPYVFGGLAMLLGLIAVALLILACTPHKSTRDSSCDTEEKPTKVMNTQLAELEPKIVVIMAGNDNPTYIAKPISSTS